MLRRSCWKEVTNHYPSAFCPLPLQSWLFLPHSTTLVYSPEFNWTNISSTTEQTANGPYVKALMSNAAVVTLWPVLRGRNPSWQEFLWPYHFPWSSIYFRFLYNSSIGSLCLRYLNVIKTTRASKIHCQEQSYHLPCILLTLVANTEKITDFKPSPVVFSVSKPFEDHCKFSVLYCSTQVFPELPLLLFNNESLQSLSFASAALLK